MNLFMKRNLRSLVWVAAALLSMPLWMGCNDKEQTAKAPVVVVPQAPDYTNDTMWYRVENDSTGTGADVFYIVSTWEFNWVDAQGDTCYYADVWNAKHRSDMNIEQSKVAAYMADGNNFYAPYYRHMTLECWAYQNEDTLVNREGVSMGDVQEAFEYFQAHRDRKRPFVLAGFSQGGLAVVSLLRSLKADEMKQLVAAYVLGYKVTPEDTVQYQNFKPAQSADDLGVTICYNTVKDAKYIVPIISAPCAMCINPVNWRTDATPATLADSITITVDPVNHVLIAKGYEGSEYQPIVGVFNVGDIHSCEPWLYSECLHENIKLRVQHWREVNQ
jgi:hypothetical protein